MKQPQHRATVRLISITAVIFSLILVNGIMQEDGRVAVALAKGNQMLGLGSQTHLIVNQTEIAAASQTDAQFVEAVRLSEKEGRQWGCAPLACALATFFDFKQGITLKQIIHLETATKLAEWTDDQARPAGTSAVLPLALAIAAADDKVRAILGDIGAADPVMVPMSGWLTDDDCQHDWCVDLTFQAPQGDGRVFHVFVNLEQTKVARTFYTRARPEIEVALPQAQRGIFRDGCHDQAGWHICWQMTADDGLNFTEATFRNNPIFQSAKIGQVEAYYPSWPGGYRDEIGFNATVRPFGPTEINDVEGGFEVRQLFTEFTSWPNCTCCYRYEQIVTLYGDGRYEFRFTSHGPGCDDLSIYRPFWRIELNGDNQAWVWQKTEWQEIETEAELHPFIDDLSPDGFKLATRQGEQLTRWLMEQNDPLGQDEANLFLLQNNRNQGEGQISPGPGNLFRPPRQWLLNNDPLSGEAIVLWFVPSLKTKQSEPWWCMPDPQPNINQCEAILRAVPVSELEQPLIEEPTATPTITPSPTPLATNTPLPTSTPRPIAGNTAEEIILNAGCGICHAIGELGEGNKVGPDLSNIGGIAAARVPGQDSETYLRQSILEPNAFIAPGCPNGPCLPNIMPRDYKDRLSPIQLDILISYLQTQIEPTPEPFIVIGTDNLEATAVSKTVPLPKTSNPPRPISSNTAVNLQILLLGIGFLLVLIVVLKRPFDSK